MPGVILDPTGKSARRQGETTLAPRPANLRGARVGVLENPKHNSDVFMQELGRLLAQEHRAEVVMTRRKTNIAAQVADEVARELLEGCDVLVAGVGD
jgi:hypothetical protein